MLKGELNKLHTNIEHAVNRTNLTCQYEEQNTDNAVQGW